MSFLRRPRFPVLLRRNVQLAISNQHRVIAPYTIRQMELSDLPTIKQLFHGEKWIMEKAYLECAYSTDPKGFFVADSTEAGIIGTVGFLSHQDRINTAGLCVVQKDHRNASVGRALEDTVFGEALKRPTFLFVFPQMLNRMKSRYGFSPSNSYMTWYNYGQIDPKTCLNSEHEDFTLLPLDRVPFSDLISYDTGVHLVPRPTYLYHWTTNDKSTTYVAVRGSSICGYGVLRPQDSYNQIGPLYADDDLAARALFRNLNSHLTQEQTVGYSCPVTNGLSMHLAAKNGMMKSGFPLVFLTSKHAAFEPDLRRVYAMSSVSFGIC